MAATLREQNRKAHTRLQKNRGGCWSHWVTTIFSWGYGSNLHHRCSLPKRHMRDKVRKGVVVQEGTDHLCVCGHTSVDGRGWNDSVDGQDTGRD